MKTTTQSIFDNLFIRYPILLNDKNEILKAFECILDTYRKGGKVLTCGNGGSASDAEHIVGELMKCFCKKRPLDDDLKNKLAQISDEGKYLADLLEKPMPAIALTSHIALSTAYANDREPKAVFAQQLLGLGKSGDTLIAISTSGNSYNCILAVTVARALGIKTVALTGMGGGKLKNLCDITISVEEKETYKIQELHLPIYHALCLMLEEEFI